MKVQCYIMLVVHFKIFWKMVAMYAENRILAKKMVIIITL